MSMSRFILLPLIAILAITSCDSPSRRLKRIETAEKKLEATVPGAAGKDQTASDLKDLYLSFVSKYPADEQAPEMLYRAAMLEADRFQKFEACISLLERVRREYPAHKRAENALFLIGYTYAEQMHDFEKAKTYYEAFLQQYPQSELTSSVTFELANLGKPVEELDIFKSITSPEAAKADK
jgi:TolA-binding protein